MKIYTKKNSLCFGAISVYFEFDMFWVLDFELQVVEECVLYVCVCVSVFPVCYRTINRSSQWIWQGKKIKYEKQNECNIYGIYIVCRLKWCYEYLINAAMFVCVCVWMHEWLTIRLIIWRIWWTEKSIHRRKYEDEINDEWYQK